MTPHARSAAAIAEIRKIGERVASGYISQIEADAMIIIVKASYGF